MTGVKTQLTRMLRSCVTGIKVKRNPTWFNILERLGSIIQLNKLEPPSIRDTGLGLAYRSGEAWNEFGWSNAEFDALLAEANSIADADARREVAVNPSIVVEEGVTIQPYWRSLYRSHAQMLYVTYIAYHAHVYKWGLKA